MNKNIIIAKQLIKLAKQIIEIKNGLIDNISFEQIKKMMKEKIIDFDLNGNSNPKNLTKNKNHVEYAGIFNNNKCYAICAYTNKNNIIYLSTITSFQKGMGKKLIKYLMNKNCKLFYLMKDPTVSNEKLTNYYRSFDLQEYNNKGTIWFYKNYSLNNEELKKFKEQKMFHY